VALNRTVDVAAPFARAPIFSALPEADRGALQRAARVVELKALEQLWRQGQRADHVGLVLTGRLKVTREHARRELIIDLAGPGDVIGEVALSLKATYQFNVRCLRRAQVLLVPSRVFRGLLEKRPAAATALAIDLAQQLLRLTRRLEALGAGDVEHRLARVMLGLVDRFGADFPGGTLVPVKLRREDLASLAATTLESASRRLSSWKRQGIVVPQRIGYLVRDVGALRRLVDG
jgi:CRP-like cAMP-binding protein